MSVPAPPRAPAPPTSPTEALGPPAPKGRSWWQHGWAVVAVAVLGALVGAGVGAAGNTSTKTVTAEGRTTTVQAAPNYHEVKVLASGEWRFTITLQG